MRFWYRIGLVIALAATAAFAEPRVERMSHAGIDLTITVEPGEVRVDEAILLTIHISAPSEIDVTMPDIRDRLRGFKLIGSFDQNPPSRDGRTVQELHARLIPLLADRYRIAPMPVTYVDKSRNPAVRGWFHTPSLTFPAIPPLSGEAPDDIEADLQIRRVPPSPGQILFWAGIVLGAAALAVLTVSLSRKIHRAVRLMRMAPRERALHELQELLARDLVAKGLVKDFYVALTMIVRRYIERQHAVRAPEQTTREFLDTISEDPRFAHLVMTTLKEFLEAADLVKFAAHQPSPEAVDNAIATARTYIQTDSKDASLRPNTQTPNHPSTHT